MKKKILVVDDEENFVQLLKKNLELTGSYDVETETDGSAVLETAKTFKPDIIILDIMMPGIDGTQVARKLKGDSGLKDTPIVFLTAAVTKEETREHTGFIAGHYFIAKPVDITDLILVIEEKTRGETIT